MGAFDGLLKLLRPSQPFVAPINDPFVQLDRTEAVKRLRLEERGAEQGALNLPPPEMQALDSVEADIIAEITDHFARAQIEAANQLRVYDGRLSDLTTLAGLSSIRSHARQAVSDFKAEVVNQRNRLAVRRDAVRDSFRELRDFRAANSLNRPAHRAPSALESWGVISTAWLVETGANTLLLRFNDDFGVIGGAFAAAAVAAVNILMAYLLGYLVLPRFLSRSLVVRIGIWITSTATVSGILLWNLLAAHFRDAKSAGASEPEIEALALLRSEAFALDSIYSWGLLLVGVICAGLSARSAYRMDDPFPGYGDVSRRHDERCTEYANEVAAATEELRYIRDDSVEGAEKVRNELSVHLRERERVTRSRQGFLQRYAEHTNQIEQTANALLEVYRTANRRARTQPAPSHFDHPWKLTRVHQSDHALPDANPEDLRAAEQALEQAVDEVMTSFVEALESFEPLDLLNERLASDNA